jgi:hypothetical protein
MAGRIEEAASVNAAGLEQGEILSARKAEIPT